MGRVEGEAQLEGEVGVVVIGEGGDLIKKGGRNR
jgi:hypothetical protein